MFQSKLFGANQLDPDASFFKGKVFSSLKGQVQCFSMQIVMNKCFFLNPEQKNGANPSCRFHEKRKKRTL